MPRKGYTNVPPAKMRNAYLKAICDHLAQDVTTHRGRLDAIDYALRKVAQELAPVCEGCGKPLPLSASPYFVDIGESVWLCDECAEPEEEPQGGQ